MGELRDRYHAGHNPPGWLDAEPACFDYWSDAAHFLVVTMTEYAAADDEDARTSDPPRPAGMRHRIHEVLSLNPPAAGPDYSAFVEDNRGRLIHFWLMQVLCLGED